MISGTLNIMSLVLLSCTTSSFSLVTMDKLDGSTCALQTQLSSTHKAIICCHSDVFHYHTMLAGTMNGPSGQNVSNDLP